jgi:hypothetical protein
LSPGDSRAPAGDKPPPYVERGRREQKDAGMSTVVVQGSGLGLRQDIVAGGHRMVADEPLEGGGTDAGPNPYELLLAALGS